MSIIGSEKCRAGSQARGACEARSRHDHFQWHAAGSVAGGREKGFVAATKFVRKTRIFNHGWTRINTDEDEDFFSFDANCRELPDLGLAMETWRGFGGENTILSWEDRFLFLPAFDHGRKELEHFRKYGS